MVRPPDETSREYGRRPYVNQNTAETTYAEEMKRLTDTVMFNAGTGAHSEYKKPYVVPSYEEMEYYRMPFQYHPYNPIYPPDMMDLPPDIPFDPNDPPDIYFNLNPDKKEDPQGCFDEITSSLEIFPSDLLTIAPRSGEQVLVSGGPRDVYSWQLAGAYQDVYFTDLDGHTVSPGNPRLLWAGPNACGEGTISVTDVCNRVVELPFEVTESCGCPDSTIVMTWDYVNSATTITQGGSAIIYVLDGAPPFTYSLQGTGYVFINGRTMYATDSRNVIIYGDETSCGSAGVTVVDTCDTTINNSLRNVDSGQWVQQQIPAKGADLAALGLSFSGPPEGGWDDMLSDEFIQGEVRIFTNFHVDSVFAACFCTADPLTLYAPNSLRISGYRENIAIRYDTLQPVFAPWSDDYPCISGAGGSVHRCAGAVVYELYIWECA